MLTDALLYKIWTSQSTYTDIPKTQLRYLASAIEAEVLQAQEPVATKLETQQFNCFHVSAEDFERLADLPVGTKLYTAPQPPAPCHDGMVDVMKEDAENYCQILTLLGMEEEGSPVEEVERLISLREGMTCADCNDTGWLENREEGRYPCTCMTEAEPYQILQAKVAEQSAEIGRLKQLLKEYPEVQSYFRHSEGDSSADLRDAYEQTSDFSKGNYRGT